MKYPHEVAQMHSLAAALTSLWRIAFSDAEAVVEYREDIDCLSLRSEALAKIANTAGDNARGAVVDFVNQTIVPLAR